VDVSGLNRETLTYISTSKQLGFNRVEVLVHMMQSLIVSAEAKGALQIAPPILSRVFQTLSRGQVNLMNCKKIKATLFPFPYAQVIAVLLLALGFCTPVVMSAICKAPHWGFIFTFVPLFAIACLNYTATELEMPFGLDSNDLPLQEFQVEMNKSMLMLVRDETDLVPEVVPGCIKDYEALLGTCKAGDVQSRVSSCVAHLMDEAESGLQAPEIKLELEKKDVDPKVGPLLSSPPPAKEEAKAGSKSSETAPTSAQAEQLGDAIEGLVMHITSLAEVLKENTEAMRSSQLGSQLDEPRQMYYELDEKVEDRHLCTVWNPR